MTEISEISVRGVSASWTKRSALIKLLRGVSVRSTQAIADYNNRLDDDNPANLVPSVDYGGLGRDLQFEAIARALEKEDWAASLARPLAYRLLSNQLNYFWHENFRALYQHSGRVLNMFNVSLATSDMAFAFLLGWNELAIYQGYLIHLALNRKHYLLLQYESEHRRAQAFMLRLFADWRGDVSHDWPAYAYDEPIYNGLLEQWRNPDHGTLAPWIVAAADLHTHQAGRETSKKFYDFSDYTLIRTPIEILMLYRLRQLCGLTNPEVVHPLMEAPFHQLPVPQPLYEPDEMMVSSMLRVRQDWPAFDQIVSIEQLRMPR